MFFILSWGIFRALARARGVATLARTQPSHGLHSPFGQRTLDVIWYIEKGRIARPGNSGGYKTSVGPTVVLPSYETFLGGIDRPFVHAQIKGFDYHFDICRMHAEHEVTRCTFQVDTTQQEVHSAASAAIGTG
jgi:hypothetical protein